MFAEFIVARRNLERENLKALLARVLDISEDLCFN